MASKALQAAAIEGDVRLYEAYLRAYRAAKNPNVKYQLLSALAHFRDPKLLQRTLLLAISDEVRSQDTGRVIGDVLRSRAGGDIGWTFLKQNWDAVYKKIPWGGVGFIVTSAGSICNLTRRDELRDFMKERRVREATRATASTAERITSCVEFRDLQQQNLSSWIEQR
jgi:aminopeptidase 2